jgi:hypothetical protein
LVVGQAKSARRKQLGPVAIPGERARLAHQPLNHVPIIDVVLVPTAQTRLHFLLPLAVPHLDRVGIHPYLHLLADQPGRHRVGVPFHGDGATRLHPHRQAPERLLPPRRQRLQESTFVEEPLRSRLVPLRAHFVQEGHIGFLAGEIVAAAQEQGLLHRVLETMVALLGVAVLVPLAGVDGLRLHLVMGHQRGIAARELFRAGGLHRQAHAVAAVLSRHPAQGPDRVLETGTETLEALREAKCDVLPVRVRQHKVVHQVRERLALDRHAQFSHVREVGSAESARQMVLVEEHFPVGPMRRPPLLDATLQGTELSVREAARMPALHFLEQGLGLPAGRLFEQLDDFTPNLGERVFTRPPISRRRLRPLLRR